MTASRCRSFCEQPRYRCAKALGHKGPHGVKVTALLIRQRIRVTWWHA